jgi:uncharacterized membrane protein YgdD (TMEM256/DUF423 family)
VIARAKAASTILLLGAAAGALGVAFGAFGAHALRDVLDAGALGTWQTAVRFQFWHALALLATALLIARDRSRAATFAAAALAFGIVVFCGSLYALALGAPRALGMLTPLGGIAFLVGWLALAWHACHVRAA